MINRLSGVKASLLLVTTGLLVSACSSVNEGYRDVILFEGKGIKGSVTYTSMFHLKTASVLKRFYCQHQRWPTGSEEFVVFGKTNSSISEDDWQLLRHPEVRFDVSESLLMTTPKTNKNREITSVHDVPDCVKNIKRVSFKNWSHTIKCRNKKSAN